MSTKHSLSDYLESDCKLKDLLMAGLYSMTGGRPCEECAHQRTSCNAFATQARKPKAGQQNPILQTNLKYSKENAAFLSACKKAECEATQRQASKFRGGKGIAYSVAVLKTMQPLKLNEPGWHDWSEQ